MMIFTACAGRVPSAHTASSITLSHFKSYGKKYKDSMFGQGKVIKAGVARVTEQSRKRAEIEAVVEMSDGHAAHVLVNAKREAPFGWRVDSWEMLESR